MLDAILFEQYNKKDYIFLLVINSSFAFRPFCGMNLFNGKNAAPRFVFWGDPHKVSIWYARVAF